MRNKLNLTVIFISLFLSACSGTLFSQGPTYIPPREMEPQDFMPPVNKYDLTSCENVWTTNSYQNEYAGFEMGSEVTSVEVSGDKSEATVNLKAFLSSITINDRIVDLKTNKDLFQTEQGLSQELNPQKWIDRASVLAKTAPNFTAVITYDIITIPSRTPDVSPWYEWRQKSTYCTPE